MKPFTSLHVVQVTLFIDLLLLISMHLDTNDLKKYETVFISSRYNE